VFVYELNRTKQRYRKVKDIQCPGHVQYIDIRNERLCIGYPSSFAIYSIQGDGAPIALISSDDTTLQFLLRNPIDALLAVEISHKEYLLVFTNVGIYVDSRGQRSRPLELMWPSPPYAATYTAPHLTLYTENVVFVFDVITNEWLQTLPLKRARPLCSDGSLVLSNSYDSLQLVYMRHMDKESEDKIALPDLLKGGSFSRGRRRFSFKTVQNVQAAKAAELRRSKLISGPSNFSHIGHIGPEERASVQDSRALERKSRIISAPTNFSHVAHMGPDQGMKVLIDLPQRQESTGPEGERLSIFNPNTPSSGGPVPRGSTGSGELSVSRQSSVSPGTSGPQNGCNGAGSQSSPLGSIKYDQQQQQRGTGYRAQHQEYEF
jgi:serine/threonine-protein kinase MRCK